MSGVIHVLLADDDIATRIGLHTIIAAESDIEVVGEAATGHEACTMAAYLEPDVVLMDVKMPDLDGIEATRRITATANDGDGTGASPRVIVLTTYDVDEYVYRSMQAGASGFLLKRTRPEELLDAIRAVARGDVLPSPASTRDLIERWSEPQPERWVSVNELTEREHEVLASLARGGSNAEIAGELHVSVETVRTHVKHIYAKLGARDRAQAVIAAYETGIVTRGDT